MNQQHKESFRDLQQTYFEWRRSDTGYQWSDSVKRLNKPVRLRKSEYSPAFWKNATRRDAMTDQVVEMRRLQAAASGAAYDPPFLIPKDDMKGWILEKPLETDNKMFLTFASLGTDPTAFEEFANEHGNLTDSLIFEIGKNQFSRGDALATWQNETQDMAWLVQVWEWQNKTDKSALGRVIHWTDNHVEFVLADTNTLEQFKKAGDLIDAIEREEAHGFPFARGLLAFNRDSIMGRFKRGDVMLPAQYLLQVVVNDKLELHGVLPRLIFDDKNEFRSYLMPRDLLGALWLQFYLTLTGEHAFKRCALCGDWEDVTEHRSNWTKHPSCANRARSAKSYEKNKTPGRSATTKGRPKK